MSFISGVAGMLLQHGNTAPVAETLNNGPQNPMRNGGINQINNGVPHNNENSHGFGDHPSKDKQDSGLLPYSSQNGGQYAYNKIPVTGLAVGSGAGFDTGSGAGLGAVLSAGLGICSVQSGVVNSGGVSSGQNVDVGLEAIRKELNEGWTAHIARDGRIYYCNHVTRTAGWLPPAECWVPNSLGPQDLPYGWEQATDHRNRPYYINHVNKTTTYEAPGNGEEVEVPTPRSVTLVRDPELGFGFVAGSEKPVLVRSVTEGGPSVDKLEPGDQILSVNGEDVEQAPRDHVIGLVRACATRVNLVVCQPLAGSSAAGRRSAILSRARKARLRAKPGRVRFAESVCVNGSPLFPPSAFSLGDLCLPPMANVLKVFLENGQTKSFKYDATTTVQDVVISLKDKLCITAGEHFSLVVEHVKSLRRNKLTLLDPKESLARIAARPGAHKLRCLFRVSFVPTSAAELAQKDLNAMDYLYMQCCNDVAQERFAPELQPEVALRLAALHMHQHALAHNMSPAKLTVKAVEREFGLERFIPCGLLETMKRKELKRLIAHFLKLNLQMTGNQQKYLSQLQAKLHYLDIISGLPSYGAKCFSSNQPERVLLVSPRFGLSQIAGIRNSIPTLICNLEDLVALRLMREDDVSYNVTVYLVREKVLSFSMEDRDGAELALVLNGYYRLATGKELEIDQEREPIPDDIAPPYLSQHNVVPSRWSYMNSNDPNVLSRSHYITFAMPPPYHSTPKMNVNGFDTNMNSVIANKNHSNNVTSGPVMGYTNTKQGNKFTNSVYDNYNEADEFGKTDNMWIDDNLGFDFQSILSMEILEAVSDSKLVEARNEEILKRVSEMQKLVESSEQYLTEQGEIVYKHSTNGSEKSWQESSVDRLESDTESNHSRMSSLDDTPGTLKHSDSLILLTETINQGLNGINTGLNSIAPPITKTPNDDPLKNRQTQGLSAILNSCGLTDALAALSTDLSQSESDNDSSYTPTSSPIHRQQNKSNNLQSKIIRTSFGLHSPDNPNYVQTGREQNLREYLHQLRENSNNSQSNVTTGEISGDVSTGNQNSGLFSGEMMNMIELDPDLIDLTLLPPPQTPDELDGTSHVPEVIPMVPSSFADKNEVDDEAKKSSDKQGNKKSDFEEFLANVTIDPPTLKVTPAVEITPEEIMSYIIPPPPVTKSSVINKQENIYSNQSQIQQQEITNVTNSPSKNQAATGGSRVSEIRDMFNAKSLSQARNSLTLSEKNFDKNKIYDVSYLNIETSNKNVVSNSKVPTSNGQVIEYPTVERKSVFSCCTKDCKQKTDDSDTVDESPECEISPPPRVTTKIEPPERPPKSIEVVNNTRPRSNSFSYSFNGVPLTQPMENRFNTLNSRKLNYNMVCSQNNQMCNGYDDNTPPIVPPRGENVPNTIPPHILMPPKKPPLPPVPSLEVLRMKAALKNVSPTQKNGTEQRVASIGSPHFQRNPNLYRDIELEHQTTFSSSEPPPVAMRSRTHSQPECSSQNLSLPLVTNDLNKTGHQRSHSETKNTILKNREMNAIFSLCSPQMNRKLTAQEMAVGYNTLQFNSESRSQVGYRSLTLRPEQTHTKINHVRFKDHVEDFKTNTLPSPSAKHKTSGECPAGANGHVINVETLLQKTEVAVDGLLSRLHQVAQNCSHQHAHGGGEDIDERKFQVARDELTNEAVSLVTGSRSLVAALAAGAARGVAGPLAECLNSLRKLADLSQALGRHTSAPLQTRNLVLRVHDVAAAFKELSGADMAKVVREHNLKMADPQQNEGSSSLEGQLALRAECLANVLATLLRSLRVFSP